MEVLHPCPRRQIGRIFEEKKFSEQCWTHDFEVLLRLAGLETLLKTDFALNPTLAKNWQTVKDWNEVSRYEQKTQTEARRLFDAINDNPNGVLQWIRNYW